MAPSKGNNNNNNNNNNKTVVGETKILVYKTTERHAIRSKPKRDRTAVPTTTKKSSCETEGIIAITEEELQAKESDGNAKRHTPQIMV